MKFKMSKKTKQYVYTAIATVDLIASFFLLAIGTHLYYLGFHNVDLAFNAISTGVFNLTTIDMNNDFQGRTLQEGYILGSNQMHISIYVMLFAGIYFIFALWMFNIR